MEPDAVVLRVDEGRLVHEPMGHPEVRRMLYFMNKKDPAVTRRTA